MSSTSFGLGPVTNGGGLSLTGRKRVTKPSDFDVPVSGQVEYFIDGIVDMGSTQIVVGSDGINITGYNFELSQLISNEDNYTMFISDVGGSGSVNGKECAISASGNNSAVYGLVAATGNESFELTKVNYNNCTSLGVIDGYRQGLETGTGRLGGSPQLTLSGTWLGGYFIETSIVRFINPGSYSLFNAGLNFTMNSRFRGNPNVNLATGVSFCNFSSVNFPNPSTFQIINSIFTINGSINNDPSIVIPNLQNSDLICKWSGNIGLTNTHEGGRLTISSELVTNIGNPGEFQTISGVWDSSLLEHFDSPSSGQLRNLSNSPVEYEILSEFIVDGDANKEVTVRLVKFDSSQSSTIIQQSQTRQINSLVGGRNVAFFNDLAVVVLNINDYCYYEITNNTDSSNVTVENGSFFIVKNR